LKQIFVFAAGIAMAHAAFAQELVKIETRPGVTQSFLIANMGKRAETGRCDPLSAHGFFGKEPETVAAIAAWMVAKPFAREIQ
jgi:hypothetical protein